MGRADFKKVLLGVFLLIILCGFVFFLSGSIGLNNQI